MAYSNSPQYNTYQQKQIPFLGNPDPRDYTAAWSVPKDERMVNVFGETWIDPRTGEKNLFIRKRSGLIFLAFHGFIGEVRGTYSDDDAVFYVVGNTLFRWNGIASTPLATLTTSNGRVGMTKYPYQDQFYLLITDGTTLWWMNLATSVFTTFPAGYPVPHYADVVVIDGYVLLAKVGTADIYNSQLDDNTLPWDFITAEMYPDILVGLNRYNNYVVAIGTQSIELFYDAALDTGSPFQRNESAIATIGCPAPRTMIQTDRNLFWIGTTDEGEYSVWMMTDFKPQEIGSPSIKQVLAREGQNIAVCTAYTIRTKGHHFYMIHTSAGMWAYDIDEKLWAQWTFDGFGDFNYPLGASFNTGQPLLITDDRLATLDPQYPYDYGVPITAQWTTNPLDFSSMNRKFLSRLTIVGDSNFSADDTLQVEWSDDNYRTWSTPRTIRLNANRPALVNLGYFRRRAFRYTHTAFNDLRLLGAEYNFNMGVN